MTGLWALGGLVLGGLAGGVAGMLAGGVIGVLVGLQLDVRKRLHKLERSQAQVEELRNWATEMKAWAQQTHAWLSRLGPPGRPDGDKPTDDQPTSDQPARADGDQPTSDQPISDQPDGDQPEPTAAEPSTAVQIPATASASPPAPDPASRAPTAPPPAQAPSAPAHAPSAPAPPRRARPSTDPVSMLVNWAKRWVTTGNAPVKVGVLVSLVGVGLLLREAHRRGIIEITIEVRLAAAAVFGLVLLAVGWRQRRKRPVYGVSLQGGGIAVLYVVVYAAYVVYDVLPAVPAAAAVVVVTAGAGLLAVLQNARTLAVLGIIGGFTAPVLTYSRPEDHIYVFSFFLVLNAAIVGVAWFKTWPELNLLGFAFTFGLTLYWMSNRYETDEWVATQPFIAAFVLVYTVMPAMFAARHGPDLKGLLAESRPSGMALVHEAWSAPLVLATPFLGLGLQQLAAGHTEYGVAISAAGLAAVQAALALVVRRMGVERHQLAEVYAALGVALGAIAVPLALNAYFTSTVWAVQGLVLVWLGRRRGRLLALGGGALLQLLAAASFAEHLSESLPYPDATAALVNEFFGGALLLALVGLASGWLLAQRRLPPAVDPAFEWIALVWGTAWWLAAGLMEIDYQIPDAALPAALAFTALSLGGAALASRRLCWPHLDALGYLVPAALVAALCVSLARQSHPFDVWGWAAWPAALGTYCWVLRRREDRYAQLSALLHAGGFWIVAVLAAVEVHWQVDRFATGVWPLVAALAAGVVLAGTAMRAGRAGWWPVATNLRSYTFRCSGPLLALVSAGVLLMVLVSDGDASPLPFLPVLNPVLVLGAVAVWSASYWAVDAESLGTNLFGRLSVPRRGAVVAALGLVTVTLETARAVHHAVGVDWQIEALFDSTELQTSLSILWAVIGLSGMVAGVRMSQRAVWVAAASWMAVVVVKLFVIDLSNLSAVGRVVSFIVVGVLLLIVGYLAPVPPAASEPSGADDA